MNMQQDVVNTCRSSYMHISKIYSIRKYLILSKESTLTLVNATVLIRLDYCNSIYIYTYIHRSPVENTCTGPKCSIKFKSHNLNTTVSLHKPDIKRTELAASSSTLAI